MPEWIGKTVGKVRIEKYLARGGMAEVYLGTHLTLERPVAVKVLHSFIEQDSSLLARFQREAKVVAGLRHNNIVQILDFDAVDGHPYIVMEYLAGPSLAAYLRNLHERDVRLSYNQVARLLKPLAAALDYAHSQDIIHRDIKPANILLHSKGKANDFDVNSPLTEHVEPVVTDFGLVRIAHSTTQTTTGAVSGTPAYMSPEQARGDRVDHCTDIYSLGVVLYEMLAGRVPFESDSGMSVLFMHINEPPPPIQGIHPALQKVIQRALAKKPDERYQTCHELAADFVKAIEQSSQSETIDITLPPTPVEASQPALTQPAPVTKKPKSWMVRNWKRVISFTAGAFACICVLLIIGMLFDNRKATPTATKPPVGQANTPLATEEPTDAPVVFPPVADGFSVGTLHFQDSAADLDQVSVFGMLVTPPAGSQYEAWLVSDGGEARRSLGVLKEETTGVYTLTFTDPQERNLLDRFDRMEVTLEPNPDNSPNPSKQVIYSSALPPQALVHIRHLLLSFKDAPEQISLIHGMTNNVELIVESAKEMQTAFDAGDEAKVRANAETIINLIAGDQDTSYYKDWDDDGTLMDTGDGYGLLLNGDQSGYILGTISHAGFAAEAEDSTSEIRLYAKQVITSTKNVEEWTPALRDTVIRIVQAPSTDNMKADITAASALANQILNGADVDGGGFVDPIPGEGGVYTAYDSAYYMADMIIFPGAGRVPGIEQAPSP